MARTGRSITTNEERFWVKVDRRGQDDCWEWQACCNSFGYGQFRKRISECSTKLMMAHRFSYELHDSQISEGKLICHTCDNPRCVNPKHLYEGTYKTNNRDAVRRGRHKNNPHRGSEHFRSKLTEHDVRSIRINSKSSSVIARDYGIDRSAIYKIRKRKTWAWLV